MRVARKLRVIHLPANVGNVANTLSRELTSLGFRSSTMVFYEDRRFEAPNIVVARRTDPLPVAEIKKLFALRYVLLCEVAVFNFGSTLFNPAAVTLDNNRLAKMGFPNSGKKFLLNAWRLYTSLMQRLELSVLRARKVRIIAIYQGDDVRQKRSKSTQDKESFEEISTVKDVENNLDRLKSKQVTLMSKYASKMFALNPDLLRFLPSTAEFLPYMNVSLNLLKPRYPPHSTRSIRICHAPTSREAKGTPYIISAIEELRNDGEDIHFELIENRSHTETLHAISNCDLFIDQLLVGWYGGVAVEAMALGKPVICYIDPVEAQKTGQIARELPVIIASTDSIKEVIKNLVHFPDGYLRNLGVVSRKFVERWHNPSTIAQDIERVLLN